MAQYKTESLSLSIALLAISDTSDTISHIIASIKVFLFSFFFLLITEIGKMLSDVSDIIIID